MRCCGEGIKQDRPRLVVEDFLHDSYCMDLEVVEDVFK